MRACWLLLCVLGGIAHAELEVSSDGAVIDGKRLACGQEVTVVGTYADDTEHAEREGDFRSPMRIKAASIDARAAQHTIDFHLFSSDPKWVEAHRQTLKVGSFYTVRGVIRDGVGGGDAAHFYLEVESTAKCPPFHPAPRDFAGQYVVFQGKAAEYQNHPAIQIQNEWVRLDALAGWPDGVLGKEVSAEGTLAVDADDAILKKPAWELCDLKEMVGQNVSLKGSFQYGLLNRPWKFRFRDTYLYVDGPSPQPSWINRAAVVTGRLERQMRFSLEPGATGHDLAECFVVRDAQSTMVDAPDDRKVRGLSHMAQKFTDGVADLAPELPGMPMSENDTELTLMARANVEVLRALLHTPSDATRKVLLRKMSDHSLPEPLRLFYAGVLAELGERAGCEAVLAAAKNQNARTADALWLMSGGLHDYRDQATPAPDWSWADDFLIEAINDETQLGPEVHGLDRRSGGPFTMRQAVFYFGHPEFELANSGRAKAIDALIALAAKNIESSSIYFAMGVARPALPPEPLLRIVKQVSEKERNNLREVLGALLQQGNSDAAWWFAPNLGDDKVFNDFLEYADSDAVALVEVRLPELKGRAQIHARELLLDRAKDSAGELLRWIDDPKCPARFTALCRLEHHPDPRIPSALAKMLRTWAPRDLGGEEFARQQAAEQALEVMARCGEPAIDELIGLLDADLGRFGSTMDSAAFHREIAGHLSEITHEGFGPDQAAWRRWREQHRKQ